MQIKAIALRFGYVESTALSWLVFAQDPYEAQKTPTSSKEAFHSLVEMLYQKVGPPKLRPTKKCCQKSVKADPDNKFCSKCGHSLLSKFSLINWENYINQLGSNTIDDFGYSDGAENPYGWDASQFWFGIPDNEMIIVQTQAEKMLTLGLFDLHPELVDLVDEPDEVPVMGPENYLWEDYQELLADPPEDLSLEGASRTTITHYYPNGAEATVVDGKLDRVVYNTGDWIWFVDGKPSHGITHDSIKWNMGEETDFSGKVQAR